MKKKVVIDSLLFIFILLEFSRGYMEPVFHEIFGIILMVLAILHLILNKNYIKNIPKGKYNTSRMIMLVINIGFMIFFFVSLLFGLLSSQDLLTFLNINNFTIIKLHKVFGYLSLIFMGLHLGINLNRLFDKLTNKINKYFMMIIEMIIIGLGIYSFIKLDIWKHMIGEYGFSITEGNIIINLLEYLSIILEITIVTHNLYKFIKKGK